MPPDGDPTLDPRDLLSLPSAPTVANGLTSFVVDGQFRLIAPIGAGGMGTVWLADQSLLGNRSPKGSEGGRRVVLKFLNRSGNAAAVERFRREAQAVAALNHPNIVQIYLTGEVELPGGVDRRLTGGLTPYLVMEHVEGATLRAAMRAPMPEARALRIVEQLTSALVAAHAVGIIHRDLKPENVMLTERWGETDVVKVLDFGIAKLEHGTSPALTQAGSVFGTPRYMSPEQAQGKAVDARADLYAVGVILYELVCGAPPFEAESAVELMAQHATAPVPVPHKRFPAAGVSEAVERLILRTLEKRPDRRTASAAELRAAVRALASASESAELPAHRGQSLRSKPAPGRAVAAAALGATLAAGAVGTLFWATQSVERPPVVAAVGHRAEEVERHARRRAPEAPATAAADSAPPPSLPTVTRGASAAASSMIPAAPPSRLPEEQPAAPPAAAVDPGEDPEEDPEDEIDALADQLLGDAMLMAGAAMGSAGLTGATSFHPVADAGIFPGAVERAVVMGTATYTTEAPVADVIAWYDARWPSGHRLLRVRDEDHEGHPRLILSGAMNPALPFFNLIVHRDLIRKGPGGDALTAIMISSRPIRPP